MPRSCRIYLPGVPSHVTVRGNDKQDIVRCDGDRLRLVDVLRAVSRNNGLAIHAYVVMSNHVHLLATGARPESLPKAIQAVGRRYVSYFNSRYARTGTLWEGRYKASLVITEEYLVNCHRYIEFNPVRGGMVDAPADFPWSSHRFYAGGQPDDLVTPHECWLSLGNTDAERREIYRSVASQPLADDVIASIRLSTRQGWAIGSDQDCKALEAAIGRRVTAIGSGWKKGRPRRA